MLSYSYHMNEELPPIRRPIASDAYDRALAQETERREYPRPYIEYDPKLLEESNPYAISFDAIGYGQFLQELGLNANRINQMTVKIQQSPQSGILGPDRLGEYYKKEDAVIIYTDPLWDEFKHLRKEAVRMAQSNLDCGFFFKGYLHTKRLGRYLAHVPEERSVPFAEKLLGKTLQRQAVAVLLHESSHAKEAENTQLIKGGRRVARLLAGALGGQVVISLGASALIPPGENPASLASLGLTVLGGLVSILAVKPLRNHFSPEEIEARRFAKDYIKDIRWHNLITITAKKEASTLQQAANPQAA